MNDFLLNLGFSKELINDIIKVNGENTYADLCLNSDEVEKIINYFKEIGITCLNELLIYNFFNNSINKIIYNRCFRFIKIIFYTIFIVFN